MKDCFEMSSSCFTAGYPHSLREFPMMNIGLPPPHMNWHYPPMYQSKPLSPPEGRDSGVHLNSDFNVSSPSSGFQATSPSSGFQATSPSSDSQATSPSSDGEQYHNQQSPKSSHTYPTDYRTSRNNSTPNVSATSEENINSNDDSVSHSNLDASNDANGLASLQMCVEKNLNISSSPEIFENNNDEYGGHEDYSVPTVNSHGKIKTVKCKQCQLVFNTKLEFWTHQRSHIKPDRLLQCEKCPFVTEYKHHLEYHMRNHGGEKPFKCQSCDYKCVNKSMLNSHMKSHSNIYQYRCASCQYSSKYCHSLKLHLRKYNHQPAMVLNPDGTPNPLPIIDVYGTRRGPKVKTMNGEEELASPKKARIDNFATMMPQNLPMQCLMPPSPMIPQNSEIPPNALQYMFQQAILFQTFQRMMNQGSIAPQTKIESDESNTKIQDDSVLDLSNNRDGNSENSSRDFNPVTPSTTDDEDEERLNLLYQVEVKHEVDEESEEKPISTSSSSTENLRCPHCCIAFDDTALFTIHMRFHSFSEPFTCNSCGEKCENKIEFTMHIISRPH